MSDQIAGWSEIEAANRAPSARLTSRELGALTDDELLVLLQQGHHESLSQLFDRYHRLVLGITSKIVGSRAEAEDVTQEVFFDVFRFADRFEAAKGTVRGWIIQLAYHKALNRRKYLALRGAFDQPQIEEFDGPSACAPNGDVSPENLLALRQGLAMLSPEQRRTIEMVCFEGFLLREVAARTHESLANVRHHYYRGIVKLREFVSQNTDSHRAKISKGGAR